MKLDSKQLAEAVVHACRGKPPAECAAVMDAAIELLDRHGQLKELRHLPELVMEAWYRQENTVPVTVVSPAGDIGASEQALSAALHHLLGKKIEIRQRKDAGMIGGVMVAYGDERIDLSLRAALQKLTSHLQSPAFSPSPA